MTNDWIEVLIFAGVAAFVAWRLISVLGTRTGHEPTAQPDGELFGGPAQVVVPKSGHSLTPVPTEPLILPEHWPQALKTKVAAVAVADSGFNPDVFLGGAKMAYGLVLNSFWSGDKAGLKPLLADDVLADFVRAIDARQGQAELGKRLVSIDSAELIDAELEGAMVEVTVHFVARIEDGEGTKVERDVWSFSRHLRSDDPSWLLIATNSD
jgi:predicted lipid-binding transport protein (Tim44 family)